VSIAKCWKSLALPREVREAKNYKGLQNGLGKKRVIDFQDVSEWPPKPSLSESDEKADVVVDSAGLPATARERHDMLPPSSTASMGRQHRAYLPNTRATYCFKCRPPQ
jgi:hypothetical protein